MTMSNSNNVGQFGDTTLTKVFVGGLAWETPKEVMKEHFDQYGEILEAVIINDKASGRSKGYGFVTFKDAEAAKKACVDPTPVINGRRANCNLASLGARRPRPTPPVTPPPHGPTVVGPRSTPTPPPATQVQWYYPQQATATHATPFHPQQHHQAIPYYGYTPATYIAATDYTYNHKLGYTGGAYMNGGHYSQVYPAGQHMMQTANTLMPVYHPYYHYHHHQSQAMGLPAHHIYSPQATPGPVPATLLSKPTQLAPTPVCLAVE